MRPRLVRILAIVAASVIPGASPTVALPWSAAPAAAVPCAVIELRTGEMIRFRQGGADVPEAVATDLARRIHRIEKLTSRLSNDEGFLRSADEATLLLLFNRTEGKAELLRAYSSSFGGTPPPENLFTHLDRAIDGLWEEIERLAPTFSSGTGHPLIGSLATALERQLRATVPKATFVGGMLREKQWRVRLSSLGLPEGRAMTGVLFYRIPDQPWVICREFEVAQRYFERQRADGPNEITFGCLRLQQQA